MTWSVSMQQVIHSKEGMHVHFRDTNHQVIYYVKRDEYTQVKHDYR